MKPRAVSRKDAHTRNSVDSPGRLVLPPVLYGGYVFPLTKSAWQPICELHQSMHLNRFVPSTDDFPM